jgi:hypothetical protein
MSGISLQDLRENRPEFADIYDRMAPHLDSGNPDPGT